MKGMVVNMYCMARSYSIDKRHTHDIYNSHSIRTNYQQLSVKNKKKKNTLNCVNCTIESEQHLVNCILEITKKKLLNER